MILNNIYNNPSNPALIPHPLDKKDYIIKVNDFSGPLDVLWELIKKSKIDITEVSLASITEQYLNFLRVMESLNVKMASDFIWMGSELLYYKSKALLPSEEIQDEYFTPPLPPELVKKLLEYKKYQQASLDLKSKYDLKENSFSRENQIELEEQVELADSSLFALIQALSNLLGKNKEIEQGELIFDEVLVSDQIDFISKLLEKKESVLFEDIFSKRVTLALVVASFLAILEMAKMKRIRVFQNKSFGEIILKKNLLS